MGSITVDTKYGAIDFNLSGDQPNLQEKIKINKVLQNLETYVLKHLKVEMTHHLTLRQVLKILNLDLLYHLLTLVQKKKLFFKSLVCKKDNTLEITEVD